MCLEALLGFFSCKNHQLHQVATERQWMSALNLMFPDPGISAEIQVPLAGSGMSM